LYLYKDYDPAGRLIQKTLPGGITQAYQYDAAGRLTQVQYLSPLPPGGGGAGGEGALIDQLDLTYDPEGNITGKKLANGSLSLDTAMTAQFDAANRMIQITLPSPSGGGAGGEGAKTYALTYDANGNLIQKQNTADPLDKTLYTWDVRNRLVQLQSPSVTASFAYDPLGRRIERTINGETTHYLYDGNQAIGEVRAGQTTTLLTGLSIDEAIARYASSGRLTQLTDQLGSVIRQINEAGQTQSQTAYSPYGEVQTTGDDQGNSTEYTGRENDGTGLYFYRARYYDPVLKRWISEDPIGTVGGINLYLYANAAPTMFIDPLGLTGGPPMKGTFYPKGNMPSPATPSKNDPGSWDGAVDATNGFMCALGVKNACIPDEVFICVEWECTPECGKPYRLERYSKTPSLTNPDTPCVCTRKGLNPNYDGRLPGL